MTVEVMPHWGGNASRYAKGFAVTAHKPSLSDAAVLAQFAALLDEGGIEFMRQVLAMRAAIAARMPLPAPELEPVTA